MNPLRPSLDIELESTSGATRALGEHLGSVVVLFYEPYDRISDNAPLKRALEAMRASDARAFVLLAAGDMRAFDLPGARPVARAAARAIAARHRLEILLDWKGSLARAPLSLDPRQSNVVVIGRGGDVVFRHTGVLAAPDIARFFAVLRPVETSAESEASGAC